MTVFSVCMYFNEDELAGLKISEESTYVDKIIFVEAELTFTGNPKPIRFPKRLLDNPKVDHIALPEGFFPSSCDAWGRERVQRNAPQALLDYGDDDVFIVTDVDEIVCGERIPEIVNAVREYGYVSLGMTLLYYYINTKFPKRWSHPFAVSGEVAGRHTFNDLRHRNGVRARHLIVTAAFMGSSGVTATATSTDPLNSQLFNTYTVTASGWTTLTVSGFNADANTTIKHIYMRGI